MRLLQFIIILFTWMLFFGGNIWAAAIPFQEYTEYTVLGTICAQLEKEVDEHAYKTLHTDDKNNYHFKIGETRLFINNIVTYSQYPVNPVNGMDNFRKYLRFLSHSLCIGRTQEKDFEFELIRTYPQNLYEFIYNITDIDAKEKGTTSNYNVSSISIYICKLSDIKVKNDTSMKDSQATLALYLDHNNRLMGYDFLGSEERQRNEANKQKAEDNSVPKNKGIKKDWGLAGLQNYAYLPIDMMICTKQTAGELIKAPLHLVGITIANFILSDIEVLDKPFNKISYAFNLGWNTCKEDVYEIKYIWLYRFVKLNHQHKWKNLPLNFICEPLREIPLLGDHIPRDTHYRPGTQTPRYLFISRGIYGRSAEEQDTKNWEQFMKNILIKDIETKQDAAIREAKADYKEIDSVKLQVSSIPYRYGSILDVLWSLLNISSGSGYEMAYRIASEYEIGQGDAIFLTGHSGGVQRCLVAEKLLLENQIRTQRRVGLAGPSQGITYCSKRKNNQNYITFLNQSRDYTDIVSNLDSILDITPPMCLVNWIWKRNEERIKIADPTLRHITPGFIYPETRIPASGYLGKEYINSFSNSYVGEQLVHSKPFEQKKAWWRQWQQIQKMFPKKQHTPKTQTAN